MDQEQYLASIMIIAVIFKIIKNENVAQLVECLPSTRTVLCLNPNVPQLGMVVHACKLSTLEVQAGGSEVEVYPWLHIDF